MTQSWHQANFFEGHCTRWINHKKWNRKLCKKIQLLLLLAQICWNIFKEMTQSWQINKNPDLIHDDRLFYLFKRGGEGREAQLMPAHHRFQYIKTLFYSCVTESASSLTIRTSRGVWFFYEPELRD